MRVNTNGNMMTKSEKLGMMLLKAAVLAYGALLFYINYTGRVQYWPALLAPLSMLLALSFPRPEGWAFLRAAFLGQAAIDGWAFVVKVFFVGLFSNILYPMMLLGKILAFVLGWMFVKKHRHLFYNEERLLPRWRSWAATVLALGILFLPAIEQTAGVALDSQTINTGGQVTRMVFSGDGKKLGVFIAGTFSEGKMRVYDVDTKKRLDLQGSDEFITSMALSPDGKMAAAGRYHILDKNEHLYAPDIYIWDLASGTRKDFKRPEAKDGQEEKYRVTAVAFSPDGIHMAIIAKCPHIGRNNHQLFLEIWDAVLKKRETKVLLTITASALGKEHLAYSSDGKNIMVADVGEIILLDSINGTEKRKLLDKYIGIIQNVGFNLDGKNLAVAINKDWKGSKAGSQKGTIDIWEVEIGKTNKTLQWDSDKWVGGIAYSSDGKYIASFLEHVGDTVTVWDVERGEPIGEVKGPIPASLITAVAYSPDGRFLAVASNNYVKLYEVDKLKLN